MWTILVIGATGTIGSAAADALEAKGHKVHRVGRSTSPAVQQDDPASIEALLAEIGPLDAIVTAAGYAEFGSAAAPDVGAFERSIASKLMGQIHLVRAAARHLPAHGSVTLTSGILSQRPGPGTAAVATVNSGLEGFVRAAALDFAGALRVNVVSPPFIRETALKMGMGAVGLPAAEAATAYVSAVEGDMTGETIYA